MREIKFRAWYEEDKEMQRVTDIYFNKKTGEIESFVTKGEKCNYHTDLDNHILMQYTGLKDQNGVEIFEGDVLYFEPYETHINDRVVQNIDGAYHGRLIRSGYSKLLAECVYETKVIGNIYENNDLLEE